ncbi:MAG TPA: D-glucuronyl C5-epimerase family protein, partial [Solirubrobacteraceae bacterium]
MARTRVAALAACAVLVTLGSTETALAAPVEVLGPGGHVHVVNNRFLPGTAEPPGPVSLLSATTGTNPLARIAATNKPTKSTTKPKPKAPQVTVGNVLEKLELSGAIDTAQYNTYLTAWNSALAEERHLPAARKVQLSDETVLLHDLAASGQMTAPRLPALFLTLQRNAQWWLDGALLSYGQRVQFSGSKLVWEYYPGQGIQLQVLGTFGEANGYYEAGKSSYPQLESLMSEVIPLAVRRGGALTWEYYFNFDGGHPPWVSAMAQATAMEALANTYRATRQQSYLSLAHQALPLLSAAPPAGVGVRTARGWRFLQYSFAPRLDIINAFLQTLIGLDTYAQVSGDQTAQQLFTSGNAEAEWELPSFNTGSWSLYQPGEEDDLSYHELVTGFAKSLCTDTKAPVYCNTATAFQSDLKTPPRLTQLTQVAKWGKPFSLRFKLSKVSKVGVAITGAGVKSHAKQVLYTSAQYQHGTDAIKVGKLKPGTYSVKLSATDLAGNYASLTGELIVYKGGNRPSTPPPPTSTQTGPPTPTTTTTTTTPTR